MKARFLAQNATYRWWRERAKVHGIRRWSFLSMDVFDMDVSSEGLPRICDTKMQNAG